MSFLQAQADSARIEPYAAWEADTQIGTSKFKFCFPPLSERVVGAAIEDFKNTDLRIGIAKGVEKSNAIQGALNGRLVHVLITTEETAKALLDQVEH